MTLTPDLTSNRPRLSAAVLVSGSPGAALRPAGIACAEGAMLRGGCLCGAVRYEAEAPAFHETICHCASCRRAVGAAAVAWFSVRLAALRFTRSAPARFASSAGVERSFCGLCGTSLTYASERHPDDIDVTLGSLDDPDLLPPKDHTRAAERLGWTRLCDGLPVHPGTRPGR